MPWPCSCAVLCPATEPASRPLLARPSRKTARGQVPRRSEGERVAPSTCCACLCELPVLRICVIAFGLSQQVICREQQMEVWRNLVICQRSCRCAVGLGMKTFISEAKIQS